MGSDRFDDARLDVRGIIDPDSPEPLYRQVRRHIETSIASGAFRANRPLPSSRFLAASLGISRNTVSLAYQELIAAALIESRPRSGLYPTPRVTVARAVFPPSGDANRVLPAEAPSAPDWSARIRTQPSAGLPHAPHWRDWAEFPYPFLPGQPETARFPSRAWLRALNEALGGPHARHAVQDSVDADDPLLVEVLQREILAHRGVTVGRDSILVTNGAQQALALLADVLAGPERAVALGNPGYRDAAHIFAGTGARLVPVPVDGQGVDVAAAPPHDLLYLTPSHHHPTSATLSLERRHLVLDSARRHDTLIIEDDYDSEVRFRGRPTPSLRSLDDSGRVIYVGTFSKFVAPGLRLGFIVAAPQLVAELRERRRYTTKHPSGHIQRALALFIDSGDYHRALRSHRYGLARKWELLRDLLPDALGFDLGTLPAGGLSIWAEGPDDFDASAVALAARRRGVLVESGDMFYLGSPAPANALRVGFSAIPLSSIPAGVTELGRAVLEARRRAS